MDLEKLIEHTLYRLTVSRTVTREHFDILRNFATQVLAQAQPKVTPEQVARAWMCANNEFNVAPFPRWCDRFAEAINQGLPEQAEPVARALWCACTPSQQYDICAECSQPHYEHTDGTNCKGPRPREKQRGSGKERRIGPEEQRLLLQFSWGPHKGGRRAGKGSRRWNRRREV